MIRLPIIPTVIVAIAVAVMVALGVWQIQRMHWKNDLLQSYAAARGRPPIAFPERFDPDHPPLFRRASATCSAVLDWRSASGRNARSMPGWVHIARCRTPAGGEMQAVMGWSERPDSPAWRGGKLSGVIAPDSRHGIRLVADRPAPGLSAAQPPSLDEIPNNHFAYAVQWFLFAAIAAVIYVLAAMRRQRPDQ